MEVFLLWGMRFEMGGGGGGADLSGGGGEKLDPIIKYETFH